MSTMKSRQDHLSYADLLALWRGQMSPSEQGSAEQHLLECDECSLRAASMAPTDAFVDLLVRAQNNTDLPQAGTWDCRPVGERSVMRHDWSHESPQTVCLGLLPRGHEKPFISDRSQDAAENNCFKTSINPRSHADLDGPFDHQRTTKAYKTVSDGIHPRIPMGLIEHPRYRVIELLGCGGMGNVWLAEHLVMRRQVAIKLIHPELLTKPGAIEQFQREVVATSTLNHPNLAAAYDAEKIGNEFFLVMEYVAGQSLAEVLSNEPLSIHAACRAVRDAALGLSHAHSMGLIHRDVKPGNLLRTAQGDTKLMDFGLVAAIGGKSDLSTENIIIGTPDYVSPEQAINPQAADARSDIYSLGCTLYHMLSGRVLYPKMPMLQKIDCHRNRDPEPLPALPEPLWNIVSQMLAKDPEQRFQTASEVALALEPFCGMNERTTDEVVKLTSNDRRSINQRILGVTASFVVLSLCASGIFFPWNTLATGKSKSASVAGTVVKVGSLPSSNALTSTSKIPEISLERQFPRKSSSLSCGLVFDVNNRDVYLAGADGWFSGWDIDSGQLICEIDIGTPVRWLSRTKNGNELLAATDDGLKRINLEQNYAIVDFTAIPTSRMVHISVSPDGRRAATCSLEKGIVRIWNLEDNSLELSWSAADLAANLAYVYGVDWTPDGQKIATAGDAGLSIWDAHTGVVLISQASIQREHSLYFSDDGRQLFLAGFHNGVSVLDAETGIRTATISGIDGARVCRMVGGRMLTMSGYEASLWNAKSKGWEARFAGCTKEFAAICCSPNCHRVACNDVDGNTYVWRIPKEPTSTDHLISKSNHLQTK